MKSLFGIATLLLVLAVAAQPQAPAKAEPAASGDITGMYSFVHEGEFVQIEVNAGKVTGLLSRFKDDNPEKAEFVDQFFDQATLQESTLTFSTKPIDGVSHQFSGVVERGPGKTPADEAYWQVRGNLIERRTSAEGKVTEKTHELTLKSFPLDADIKPPKP
jgi:hypothetical protein